MPYFPMFIDLTGRPCLIVGGGTVAARKAEKLRPYSPDLRVVSPKFESNFDGCTLLRRPYAPGDEEGMALVIAATDDPTLNRAISEACREKRIPVNVVDDKEFCTFLFPCLVKQGNLSVGISTGGASPTAAVWLKEQVEGLVPEGFDTILQWLEEQRPRLKAALPETRRSTVFSGLFSACMALGRPMTDLELENFLRGVSQ